MAFWGLLWPLQPGPRGSSGDEADERAELCRELHGAGAAQEAPGSLLCSQISPITGNSILKEQLP